MESFRNKIIIQDERIIGFRNEADIWKNIEDLGSRSFIVIFHGNESHFDYTIKSKSNRFMTDRHYSKDLNSISSKVSNEYVNYGFLGIQYALDTTYYESIVRNEKIPYVIQVERMPSLSHDPVSSQINSFGLFIIIFSALICIALIFTRMVEEKACGFREQLKNATRFSYLNNAALFSANHVQMTLLFFFCLFITYICKGVWFSVNFFYPLLLTFLFITSIITYTFLVSAFFESSELKTICIYVLCNNHRNIHFYSCILNGWRCILVLCSVLLLSTSYRPMEENSHNLPNQCLLPRI